MINVEEIYKLMDQDPSKEDKALIKKAYDFAEKAHEGQKRASGDPYFVHVFETAKNLARFGMDATTISAGLLHDTIEDTGTSPETIEKEFGKMILCIVNGVTKLGKLKYQGHERHAESLRKFFLAVADDYRVLIVKLADRLHNLQTLKYIRPEKQKRIALESLEIYAPLANRLGIGKLKGELEDAAFPYVFPKEHEMVKKMLEEKTVTAIAELKNIEADLTKELHKQKITIIRVSYRIKHLYSLWKKLQQYKMDIEKIYDIMALRVIVPTVEDCYRVLGIIHSIWNPLPNRIKDYIALPKLNGYQSIHTTIFTGSGSIAEIQIRTPEMHGRAEYGVASHFAYKESNEKLKKNIHPGSHRKFQWIDEFKELGKNTEKPDNFLETVKKDFFTDRIFVFTPKGDVIDLPEDSSPIDFAYAIHSEVGEKTAGAKINGKMAPLAAKLKNGDIVEITTNKNAHPASKWLDYVKTNLARKHIKQYVDNNSLINKYILKRFK